MAPDQTSAFVDIVKVTVEAPLLKVRLLNSAALAGSAAKVIDCAEDEVKVTVAVPMDQLADVELLVQDPLTVHVSDPKEMNEAAAEMVTFPVTATAPDVDVSAPPDIVTPEFTVSGLTPFARVPPDSVRRPPIVS